MDPKVRSAAIQAKQNVSNPSPYRDHGHNQFANELSRNLHDRGVAFEREKPVGRGVADIYIPGKGVVEVKAKTSGISRSDREQVQGYANASGEPAYLVNFGKHGNEPHFRKFK
ncbi:UNVERIFIED_CONTAM: hypothetical protein RMT77_016023 [Armadillidium vulgare]